MSMALCFWVLMLIWLTLGLWASWPINKSSVGSLMLFILMILLGWKVFGPPIHG